MDDKTVSEFEDVLERMEARVRAVDVAVADRARYEVGSPEYLEANVAVARSIGESHWIVQEHWRDLIAFARALTSAEKRIEELEKENAKLRAAMEYGNETIRQVNDKIESMRDRIRAAARSWCWSIHDITRSQ